MFDAGRRWYHWFWIFLSRSSEYWVDVNISLDGISFIEYSDILTEIHISQACALSKREAIVPSELGFTNPFQRNFGKPLQQVALNPGLSYDDVQKDDFQFDMDAHDVMVFLHIQKTGGTSFGRHLVQDLDLKVSSARCAIEFQIHSTFY